MSYTAPIGFIDERQTGTIWPGRWIDATGFLTLYGLGYHTGADLNLNYPYWDADKHKDVLTIGDGQVTYAQIYPNPHYWGGIIVIDHGTVDGRPLFSRYAHVEDINVVVGQNLTAGDRMAAVGNGEGLFPYHLHFDISVTEKLRNEPWHWPGANQAQVLAHYVDPKEWLQQHVTDNNGNIIVPTFQVYYVIATLGLRVRQGHGLNKKQVGSLTFGSRVSIDANEKVDQDSYSWAPIKEGVYTGDWVAMGKTDLSEVYLSRNQPGM